MSKEIFLLILIAVLSGALIYVAKRKTKYFGPMLAILFFVVSIFIVLVSINMTSSKLILFVIFIIANIPTATHLAIYFKYNREK